MNLVKQIERIFRSDEGTGVLGIHVSRPAAALGAGAGRNVLFQVIGGEVYITCLYGVCTVAETGAGTTMQFDSLPTVGGAAAPMDNGAGNCNGLLVGDVIAPQGNLALPCIVAGPLCAGPTFSRPWLAKVGSIGITPGGAVDRGSYRFELYYVPLKAESSVVPA